MWIAQQPDERWYIPGGRITRLMWVARMFAAVCTLVACAMAVGLTPRGEPGADLRMVILLPMILGFVGFRFVQDVKRLHDLGQSGWWVVCAFIPVANLIYVLFILFSDGQPFPNTYGPDPKGRGESIEDVVDVFR